MNLLISFVCSGLLMPDRRSRVNNMFESSFSTRYIAAQWRYKKSSYIVITLNIIINIMKNKLNKKIKTKTHNYCLKRST